MRPELGMLALVASLAAVCATPLSTTPVRAPQRASVAPRTGARSGSPDADALFAEWQAQLQTELGAEELSRWEREERKLSLWKRLVAREERQTWRRRAIDIEREARVELGRARQRESYSLSRDNSIFSDEVSPAARRKDDASDAASAKKRSSVTDTEVAWAAVAASTSRSAATAARKRELGAEVASTLGIDLGTTNSLVAVFQNGGPAVIEVAGKLVMPSAVAYVKVGADGLAAGVPTAAGGKGARTEVAAPLVDAADDSTVGVLVGESARAFAATEAGGDSFISVKRILGRRDLEPEDLSRMRWLAPSRLHGSSARGSGELLLNCAALSRPISAVDVSAEVLRALLDGACAALRRPVRAAVVTVPAHFSEAQRAATETACMLAGLQQVHLLREPEAAALAYGWDRTVDERCLVFDLGGGTFDVSVVDVGGDTIEIISTDGDIALGGDDFDEAIAAYLTEQLVSQAGLNPDAPSRYRIIRAAQEARHALSEATSVEIDLADLTGTSMGGGAKPGGRLSAFRPFGRAGAKAERASLKLTLSRRKMEALTKHLLERLIAPIIKVAQGAGIQLTAAAAEADDAENGDGSPAAAAAGGGGGGRQSNSDLARANVAWRWQRMVRRWAAGNSKLQRFAPGVPISRVILVGGATRMPAISRLIKRLTGIKPVLTVNPETAVAEGAAVQAAILDGLPSAGNLAVFNPHHGGRLHQRRVLANAGGVGGADADA